MQCPQCGQINADAAQFCTACGHSLTIPPQTESSIPSPLSGADRPPSEPILASEVRFAPPPMTPPAAPPNTHTAPPQQSQAQPIAPPGYATASPYPAALQASPPAYGPPTAFVTPCRVCGASVSSQSYSCPRCGTPAGMIVNPNDPTANTYLPASAPGYTPTVNSSGQRKTASGELQQGWNWGAAFVTYCWAIAHGVWWYVILITSLFLCELALVTIQIASAGVDLSVPIGLGALLYGILFVVFRIYFGTKGTQLAWQYRRFDNSIQCLDVQQKWKPCGIAAGSTLAVILALCVMMLILLFIIGSAAS